MRSLKPVLLVEDDRLDAMIVRRALNDLRVTNKLIRVASGEEATKYLRNAGNKKPCVILLDLNMPKTNGVDFLRIIKADKKLKKIPIVVLTSSTKEQKVIETFKLGIAGYIVKPVSYMKFVEAIRTLALCWTLSELP